METPLINFGYNTYILGAPSEIINGKGIVIYNRILEKSENPLPRINLDNLDLVYDTLTDPTQEYDYLRLSRDDVDSPYVYDYQDTIKDVGFNVIIYLENNIPVGYTEFIDTQGVGNENTLMYIYIDLQILTSATPIDITVTYSLDQVRSNVTSGNRYGGYELWEYAQILDIANEELRINTQSKCTNRLRGISDTTKIYLNNSTLGTDLQYGTNLLTKVDIDPYKLNFENKSVSFYGEDIVISSWEGDKYTTYSLTKLNKFSNLVDYTSALDGYISITKETGVEVNILQVVGKLVLVETVDSVSERLVFNTETLTWIPFTKYTAILDSWSDGGKLINLPKILTTSNILYSIPEVLNVHSPLKSRISALSVVSKVGEWFLLRETLGAATSLIHYSNMSKTIVAAEDEKVDIINDQVLSITSEDGTYYSIFGTQGEPELTYSEKAYALINKLNLYLDPELNIYIANEERVRLYNENNIKVSWVGKPLFGENSAFSKFRKNCLPEGGILPKITCTFRGFIFYEDNDGLLTYL